MRDRRDRKATTYTFKRQTAPAGLVLAQTLSFFFPDCRRWHPSGARPFHTTLPVKYDQRSERKRRGVYPHVGLPSKNNELLQTEHQEEE